MALVVPLRTSSGLILYFRLPSIHLCVNNQVSVLLLCKGSEYSFSASYTVDVRALAYDGAIIRSTGVDIFDNLIKFLCFEYTASDVLRTSVQENSVLEYDSDANIYASFRTRLYKVAMSVTLGCLHPTLGIGRINRPLRRDYYMLSLGLQMAVDALHCRIIRPGIESRSGGRGDNDCSPL